MLIIITIVMFVLFKWSEKVYLIERKQEKQT